MFNSLWTLDYFKWFNII